MSDVSLFFVDTVVEVVVFLKPFHGVKFRGLPATAHFGDVAGPHTRPVEALTVPV